MRYDAGPPHGVGDYLGDVVDGVPHGEVRRVVGVVMLLFAVHSCVRGAYAPQHADAVTLVRVHGSTLGGVARHLKLDDSISIVFSALTCFLFRPKFQSFDMFYVSTHVTRRSPNH